MKPGIYTMPADQYHADPCIAPSLSASFIKTMLNESPLHAWTGSSRLNPNYVRDEDKKFDIGTAAHSILLEGIDNMAIIDADDWRTKAAKEQRDTARDEGKTPVLGKDADNIRKMVVVAKRAIEECEDLSGFKFDHGKPEQVIIWEENKPDKHDPMRQRIWCRSRIDMLANDHSLIIDYKTTSGSASPDMAAKQILGHLTGEIQAAMNLRGLQVVTGKQGKFVFMVQETTAPYAVSFIGVSPAYLALGEDKVRAAMQMYERCLKSNQWPGYGGRIRWEEPNAWQLEKWYQKMNEDAENDSQAIQE